MGSRCREGGEYLGIGMELRFNEKKWRRVGMGRGSGFPGCITLFPDIFKLAILFYPKEQFSIFI
jgi:hypothetical protein